MSEMSERLQRLQLTHAYDCSYIKIAHRSTCILRHVTRRNSVMVFPINNLSSSL